MERIQDACDIHDGRDVRAVVAEVSSRSIAGLHPEIARRTRSESTYEGYTVTVIEDQTILLLHQTGGLLIDFFVEAIFVQLHAEAAREKRRDILERGLVGGVDPAYGVEIGVKTRAVEARLIEILGGAHK